MLYYDCQDSGTIVFEIENSVIVVVLIFLKHRGLCGKLADSNFFLHRGFNIVHGFSCTRNAVCVHVICTNVTVNTICEGLYVSHKMFLKVA